MQMFREFYSREAKIVTSGLQTPIETLFLVFRKDSFIKKSRVVLVQHQSEYNS